MATQHVVQAKWLGGWVTDMEGGEACNDSPAPPFGGDDIGTLIPTYSWGPELDHVIETSPLERLEGPGQQSAEKCFRERKGCF